MSAVTLYQLAVEHQRLAEFLAAADLDSETIADTIESTGLPDAIADKAHALELIARTLEQHQPALDAEITRLVALRAARAAAAARVREYLFKHMLACGIKRIDTPLFSIRVTNNPPRVEIFDERMLPAAFMRQPETPPPEPNRKAIAEAIKRGEDVPGARLEQSQRLVVK